MESKLDHRWRKASYSGNGGGSCVEVGNAATGVVPDTTDREAYSAGDSGWCMAEVHRECSGIILSFH